MRKLHIRASRDRSFDAISLFIFQKEKDKAYQGQVKFKEIPQGGRMEAALFVSGFDLMQGSNVAQVLMDDLWQCGIRPSEGQGSAGQLKAVQDHLADMKKITFHKLNIEDK